MKIALTPILEEDGTRTSVTPDHIILHLPEGMITLNAKGGASRGLPMDGLSQAASDALDAFLAALAVDIKAEYETGAITNRAKGKPGGPKPR